MKKRISLIFAIIMITAVFSGCENSAIPENTQKINETEKPAESDAVMLSLADAVPASPDGASELQLEFNIALLKKLGELEEGNLFYSPMSINAAMTMAYFGANGDTQKEMADVLGYDGMDIARVAAYQKYLMQSYEDTGDSVFTEANSIWINEMFDPKRSYIDTMNDVFHTRVTKIDLFADDAVDILNGWINDSTNGMINELFDKESNPFTEGPPPAMVLLNAIYFSGKWTAPFDPQKTYDTDFNGASGKTAIRMMSAKEEIMGATGDDYISVSLPYGEDERFAMIAVLPDDMDTFIDGLTENTLSLILNTFYEQHEAVVQLPVFEMEQKVKLNDALYALGIKKAFSESEADFTGMHDADILWIDEVLHKAKINVDEEGTEAAAATSVEMVLKGMAVDTFEFIADRPFLFFIVDTENDLVLFTGKVMDLGRE